MSAHTRNMFAAAVRATDPRTMRRAASEIKATLSAIEIVIREVEAVRPLAARRLRLRQPHLKSVLELMGA